MVGFPAGLSPTSFHLSPRLGACGRVPGRLVSHFFSGWVLLVRLPAGLSPTSFHLSPTSFHLSPRLCACSRVSGRLVSHFLAFVSHFFPKQFTVRGCHFFLKMCPPFVSLLVSAHFHWPCSISIHLPGLSLLVSALFRWPCSISIHLPGLSLVVSALGRWPCSISIHLSPRSVTGVVRPFPLAMQHFYSFVSQACHCWCPPFSAGNAAFYSFVSEVCHCWCPPFSVGHVAFLFICLPGLSLPVSALFRWPCSISIHLPGLSLLVSALVRWSCSISIHVSPRPVTGDVRPFPLGM